MNARYALALRVVLLVFVLSLLAPGAALLSQGDSDAIVAMLDAAEEALATGDYTVMDDVLAENYVVHSPLGDMDRAALLAFFDSLRGALTDFSVERVEVLVDGNRAASRLTISGVFENEFYGPTGPLQPTGQPIVRSATNVFHFNEAGMIEEEWTMYDVMGFLIQMGAMPAPAAQAEAVSDAEATIRLFYDHNNAEDYDAQNALWAVDATLTLPDGTVLEGRDEVLTFQPGHSEITLTNLEVDGNTVRWTSNTGGGTFDFEAVVEDGLIKSMRFR
jgi:predicted ester cyclase